MRSLQPESFVEIGEELAKEKGIKNGGWVQVSSNRGSIKAKAVVTKRIKPLIMRRQDGAHRRHPASTGASPARPRRASAPNIADAVRRRRQHRDAGIQGVPGEHRADQRPGEHEGGRTMATFQPLDVIRRSATMTATPRAQPRRRGGQADRRRRSASAARPARSACLEWNDLREEVGINVGVYDNPHDLTPNTLDADAFHRVGEPRDRQSRVADPQGRLHALRGSGLPQGLPGARRDRAVLQRHRRLRHGELHRLRLLREGLPVQHPAHLAGRPQGLQVHAVLGPRRRRPGAGLRQGLPDPGDHRSAPRRT